MGMFQKLINNMTQSTTRKVTLIVSLFVVSLIILTFIILIQSMIFSGVRSYVRGEGLWAKAQKDSVFYLNRYTYTRDPSDYDLFRSSVDVNYGDQRARLALEQDPPDKKLAREGFLEGNNHPDDIDSMIWFFLNFRQISYLRDAITIWREGDKKIAELIGIGEKVRSMISGSRLGNKNQLDQLRLDIEKVNHELVVLENSFSDVLGEGARWVKKTILITSFSLVTMILGTGIYVSRQIIKRIEEAEKALRLSESRFLSLWESGTIGIVAWKLNGTIIEANRLFWQMLGYNEEIKPDSPNWIDMTPEDQAHKDEKAVIQLQQSGRCEPFEKELYHREGYSVPIFMGASLLEQGGKEGIAFVIDLTERKRFEQELQMASIVFKNSYDGIMITDPERKIISVNQGLCEITGYTEKQMQGKSTAILKCESTSPDQYKEMNESLSSKGFWEGEITGKKSSGESLPLRVSIRKVLNQAGKIIHYVGIFSDNTERQNREKLLQHMAHYDSLTQLPNRLLFYDRIDFTLKRAKRRQSSFALLFLDLDKFKSINDIYGHNAGDGLLITVADRLLELVRESDTVARLGGDEFVIILEDLIDSNMVEQLMNKIAEVITKPCTVNGYQLQVEVSIGYSVYPEDGESMDKLIENADRKMYGVKKKH